MPDTQRQLAEITALLADNTTGDISPQNIRDTVETLRNRAGGFSWTVPSATTIPGVSTDVKAAGSTVLGALADSFDMPTSNRLRYTGAATVAAFVVASLSFSTASSNQQVDMMIAKNGVVIAASRLRRKTGTGGDVGSTAIHADVSLSTNDYLEVFVANQTSTAGVTIELGSLSAFTIPS